MSDKIDETPLLSSSDERRLFLQYANEKDQEVKEAIREQLILSNMRLVLFFAMKYQNKGIDIEDLVSEGECALIESFEKYDIASAARFSTFAFSSVKGAMIAIITKKSAFKIAPGLKNNKKLVNQAISDYKKVHGRKPTLLELRELVPFKRWALRDAYFYQDVLPLESFINYEEDEGHEVMDNIADEKGDKPLKDLFSEDLHNEIISIFDALLTKVEKELLLDKYFYPTVYNQTYSLKEEQKKLNLSLAQLTFVEKRAIAKLAEKKQMFVELKDFISSSL